MIINRCIVVGKITKITKKLPHPRGPHTALTDLLLDRRYDRTIVGIMIDLNRYRCGKT